MEGLGLVPGPVWPVDIEEALDGVALGLVEVGTGVLAFVDADKVAAIACHAGVKQRQPSCRTRSDCKH